MVVIYCAFVASTRRPLCFEESAQHKQLRRCRLFFAKLAEHTTADDFLFRSSTLTVGDDYFSSEMHFDMCDGSEWEDHTQGTRVALRVMRR